MASFALEELKKICREKSLGYIWLTVNRDNLGSVAFYRQAGFYVDHDEVTDIGQGYVMDDHIMRLDLASSRIDLTTGAADRSRSFLSFAGVSRLCAANERTAGRSRRLTCGCPCFPDSL